MTVTILYQCSPVILAETRATTLKDTDLEVRHERKILTIYVHLFTPVAKVFEADFGSGERRVERVHKDGH